MNIRRIHSQLVLAGPARLDRESVEATGDCLHFRLPMPKREDPASGPHPSLLEDTPLAGTFNLPAPSRPRRHRKGRREGRAVSGPQLDRKKEILLADRDTALRASLGRALECEDFIVTSVETGEEAVARLRKTAPDLVLLGLSLNDENAWATCEIMERLGPQTPVIVLSAQPNQYGLALRLGIDALMEKPVDLAVLLKKIRELAFEPQPQRIERLTRANFKTDYLRPASCL